MTSFIKTLDSCKLCKHEQRAEIELALINNETLSDIIKEYSNDSCYLDIPKISVHYRRHMADLEPEVIEELNSKLLADYSSVEENTVSLNLEVDKLLTDFKDIEVETFQELNYKIGTLVKLLNLKEKAIKLQKSVNEGNLKNVKQQTNTITGLLHGK